MGFLKPHQLALIFGLFGNIISFLVFLSPVPTFYRIYKQKTSEGYQPIPYMAALSSAMLLLFYGFLMTNGTLIISINAIGCVIEVIYLVFYIIYAPKKLRINTVKWILLFNLGGYGLTILIVNLFTKGSVRVTVMGWICAAYNIAVFVSPLCIMRQVIRTKSVENMPFLLSFFLTLCATTWFFYGFLIKNYFIALPNVLGFILGMAQMIIYFVYKNVKNGVETPEEQQGGGQEEFNLRSNDDQDLNPCVADQHQEIKIDIGEEPAC